MARETQRILHPAASQLLVLLNHQTQKQMNLFPPHPSLLSRWRRFQRFAILVGALATSLFTWGEGILYDCFRVNPYNGGIYHLECTAASFEKIDFAIDDNAYNGWSATVHHIGGWGYIAAVSPNEEITESTFSSQLYTATFTGTNEFIFAFSWNPRRPDGQTDYLGWIHLAYRGGTIVIIGSALNTDSSEALPADTTEEPSPFDWKYIDYGDHVVLATDCIPATATGRVVLPKEINGKPVTGLAYHAFYARQGITELIIPDTVTDIGEAAISHCDYLRYLILPNSVTHLAVDACSSNHSLGTLKVPGSVMSLPDYVFADCSFLTKVTIASGVTNISPLAFVSSTKIQELSISKTVDKITAGTFRHCFNLRSVELSYFTDVEDGAFPDSCTITRTGLTIRNSGIALTDPEILQLIRIVGKESVTGKTELVLHTDPPLGTAASGAVEDCIRLGIYPSRTPYWAGYQRAFYFARPTIRFTCINPVSQTLMVKVEPADGTRVVQPPLEGFIHVKGLSDPRIPIRSAPSLNAKSSCLTFDDYVSSNGLFSVKYQNVPFRFFAIQVGRQN